MRLIKLLLGFLLLTVTLSCELKNVPLDWKVENNSLFSDLSTSAGLQSFKIKVDPFGDSRSNKQEIGKNIESKEARTVTTKDNVVAWCTEKMKYILKQYGMTLVENDPTIVIKAEIVNFYVTESNIYNANVTLRVIVSDPKGKVLWQGMVSGQSRRFGRSYKLDNYQEGLSNAFADAVKTLFNNPEFNSSMNKIQ